jgi:hypothetical protein
MNTTFVENRWFVNNCNFAHARLSSSEISLCVRSRSKFVFNLCVILLHSLRIINDMSSIRIRYRAYVCNWFRCKSMKKTWVSISKIDTSVTRKISKILRKHLFWMTASLLRILVFFVLNVCQIVVSSMRAERIMNVYNTRILRKMTSHVNVDIFVKVMNCFIIFFWIFRTCESHFRRMSIWIFKTRMSIFDYIVLNSILIVIVMSNFFEFLIKWINSYLIETNKNSCRIAHLSQNLCTRFRFLQFSFVLLS